MRIVLAICLIAFLSAAAWASLFFATPLQDMVSQVYLQQYPGGLWGDWLDAPPSDQDAAAMGAIQQITPLNTSGQQDAGGIILVMSIGMSNTSYEWMGSVTSQHCYNGTPLSNCFVAQARSSGLLASNVRLLNGAIGGAQAKFWVTAGTGAYPVVLSSAITPAGYTEAQVQVLWMEHANENPTKSLPATGADALTLERELGQIARAAKVQYPNLKLIFVSPRSYAGYATSLLNPEPYAYESGYAVKWLLQSQYAQREKGSIDP